MSANRENLAIGVYAPLLGGFYFGELIGQIRQSCVIKGHELTVIDTQGFGSYNLEFATHGFDIVILLRNAVHPDFVKRLQAAGKTIVSVAFDYFPLKVPVVGCDNEQAAKLACEYLYERGHRNLTFVGELGQFDIRKRYEAFCEFCETHNIALGEEHIFSVKDSLFSGGQQAAVKLVKSSNRSSGIICGSCLTAVGFIRKLKYLKPDLIDGVEVVSFDAFSVIPFAANSVTTVDQNLHLIAYSAVSIAETVHAGGSSPPSTFVQPKLIEKESDLMQSESGYLATSIELDAFYDANYMKTLMVNMHEWPREIAVSKLTDLMMLEPLFVDYLQVAIFSKLVKNSSGDEKLKILRVLFANYNSGQSEGLLGASVGLARFNSVIQTEEGQDFSRVVHIPIYNQERIVAIFSVFGEEPASGTRASFMGLCGYLNSIADALLQELRETDKQPGRQEIAAPPEQALEEGTVAWERRELTSTWDDTALAMLGLHTELERSIYRHMDITDRVEPGESSQLRSQLQAVKSVGERLYIRLRHKDKSYSMFELRCHADPEGQQVQFKLSHWAGDV
ncbi:LacI family DNA-binding transcriptional regulator [Teredinibacter turnerae]|uniref:LacI family DNA-binding transcriptional regulator n=1 Tax=Teredinibacter turnerae TaxID=2426 RepID=UPI00037B8D38|nr:LacI family DNA-binding transcriptional regulator [Teredinibacter turnerae]